MAVNYRLLLVSHDSSYTGAPILLANLGRLMKEQGHQVEFLLARGGAMQDVFATIAPTEIIKPKSYQHGIFFSKVLDFIRVWFKKRKLLRRYRKQFDFILNNTVANGNLIHALKKLKIPVLTYVHELDSVFDENRSSALTTLGSSDFFLVPSGAVQRSLLNRGVPVEKMGDLPYFFPRSSALGEAREQLRARFSLPPDQFLVVGMGTATTRKGFDLFLEVVRMVSCSPSQVHFAWIGAVVNPDFVKIAHGLPELTLTGELPHQPDVLSMADLFLLSSREDPYPLVVIEAAQQGVPTLYFEGTGGIAEFVEEDAGWPVKSLDTTEMAQWVERLARQPEEVSRKGIRAKEKVGLMHEDGLAISRKLESYFELIKQ